MNLETEGKKKKERKEGIKGKKERLKKLKCQSRSEGRKEGEKYK